jgi:hypothetical protein
MAGENYPRTAHILALIGGILIVIDGALELGAAAIIGSLGGVYGVGGALIAALGAIGLIVGLIVLYGSIQLRSKPGSAKTWGIILIILSLASYIGGGGFFLGLILTLIGGIMAYVWVAPTAPMSQSGQWSQPQPGTWGQPTAPAGGAGGPPLQGAGQRFCTSCGSPVPAGAMTCPKCGAPVTA